MAFYKHDREDGTVDVTLDRGLQFAILEALRYNYHRHTASTSDTANWVLNIIQFFDADILQVIWHDVNLFLEEREQYGVEPIEVYETDVAPFIKIRDKAETQLVISGYENVGGHFYAKK